LGAHELDRSSQHTIYVCFPRSSGSCPAEESIPARLLPIIQARVIENRSTIFESTLVKMPQTQNPDQSESANSGRLWLCPHRSLEHHEARIYFHTLAPTPRDDYNIHFTPCSRHDCSSWMRHSFTRVPTRESVHGSQLDLSPPQRTAFVLATTFNLFTTEIESIDPLVAISKHFTPKKVNHALSKLTIPICSHIRLSDSIISGHFRSDCLLLAKLDRRYRPCICSGSPMSSLVKHYKKCLDCRDQGSLSWLSFQAHEFENAGRRFIALHLTVRRDLGPLGEGPHGAGWTCHAFDAKQTGLLPHVYREWMAMMIQERRSAEGHETLKRTSKFDRLRDLLQSSFLTRDPLKYVEDPLLMKEYDNHNESKHHLTLDALLEQKARPARDECGEVSKDDNPLEGEAPPPYSETSDAVDYP
jgi:hypothetical protein